MTSPEPWTLADLHSLKLTDFAPSYTRDPYFDDEHHRTGIHKLFKPSFIQLFTLATLDGDAFFAASDAEPDIVADSGPEPHVLGAGDWIPRWAVQSGDLVVPSFNKPLAFLSGADVSFAKYLRCFVYPTSRGNYPAFNPGPVPFTYSLVFFLRTASLNRDLRDHTAGALHALRKVFQLFPVPGKVLIDTHYLFLSVSSLDAKNLAVRAKYGQRCGKVVFERTWFHRVIVFGSEEMFTQPLEPAKEPEPTFDRYDWEIEYDCMSDDEDYQRFASQTRRGWRGRLEREEIRHEMVKERFEDEMTDWYIRTKKAQDEYELARQRWKFAKHAADFVSAMTDFNDHLGSAVLFLHPECHVSSPQLGHETHVVFAHPLIAPTLNAARELEMRVLALSVSRSFGALRPINVSRFVAAGTAEVAMTEARTRAPWDVPQTAKQLERRILAERAASGWWIPFPGTRRQCEIFTQHDLDVTQLADEDALLEGGFPSSELWADATPTANDQPGTT
ncbi:hypothetical protein H9P43_006041 [Blastocladiella emersonii ATCC 22665]|nr:hypothetical protein H9P43_006041 [Blastocladiella emersonii ATCC 22665]